MREVVSPEDVEKFGVNFAPKLPAINNRISETIKEKNLTFKESAARIGISRQALDKFIRGEQKPTIEVALKLSMLLDTPVEQLFQLGKGAWFTSAKDKNGHTIFYDHMRQELRSGDAMKGTRKTVRFDKYVNEEVSNTAFNRMVKEAEKQAVEQLVAEEGEENQNRDTFARVKEAAREELEKKFPNRYEAMYHEIPEIK